MKNKIGCDLIVCLSHLGLMYKSNKVSDLIIAQKSKHIDLIIGGHTHSFLEKPILETNLDGKKVIINKDGEE